MNQKGIDYAWASVKPYDEMVKAGIKFVMRYISHDAGNTATVVSSSSKDATAAEVKELLKRGIGIGFVFEDTAQRALAGRSAGITDATFAKERVDALGVPGAVIYFAVDFDATDAEKPAIANYLAGAASVLGKDKVGVYGSFYVIKYMSEKKACTYFWQTLAWSGGQVHPSAHIYQAGGVKVGTLQCDLNKSLQTDFGVYFSTPAPVPTPKPKPAPKPAPAPSPAPQPKPDPTPPVTDLVAEYLAWRNWRTIGQGIPSGRPVSIPDQIPAQWWSYMITDLTWATMVVGADKSTVQKLKDKIAKAVAALKG